MIFFLFIWLHVKDFCLFCINILHRVTVLHEINSKISPRRLFFLIVLHRGQLLSNRAFLYLCSFSCLWLFMWLWNCVIAIGCKVFPIWEGYQILFNWFICSLSLIPKRLFNIMRRNYFSFLLRQALPFFRGTKSFKTRLLHHFKAL